MGPSGCPFRRQGSLWCCVLVLPATHVLLLLVETTSFGQCVHTEGLHAPAPVRIVNGEIVNDEDPRVQRRAGAGARDPDGQGQGRVGYGRVASLLDPPANDRRDARNARGPPGRAEDHQPKQRGPLDKLAETIGVQDRFVRIPGALGVAEREVPLIQLLLFLLVAAIVVASGGWMYLALAPLVYIFMNQQGKTGREEGR